MNYVAERLPLLAPNRTAVWVFKCQTRERPGLGGFLPVGSWIADPKKLTFHRAVWGDSYAPNFRPSRKLLPFLKAEIRSRNYALLRPVHGGCTVER